MKNKRVLLKGRALASPVTIEQRYARKLKKYAQTMTRDVEKKVMALFRSDDARAYFAMDESIASQARILLNKLTRKYEKIFAEAAKTMAERMIKSVQKESIFRLNGSLDQIAGQTIKLSEMPAGLSEVLKASISENVDLIKSVPYQYLDRIKGEVMRTITTKESSLSTLRTKIAGYGDMTERRAHHIAMDQTRKAYQSINMSRAQSAGIKKAIWIHTGGTSNPRHKHLEFDGKEFDLAKGAPVGAKGEYVMPAQEPYCRCTWKPIIDFGEEE